MLFGRPLNLAAMMNKPPIMAARTTAASAPTKIVYNVILISTNLAERLYPRVGRLIASSRPVTIAILKPQIKNQIGRGFSDCQPAHFY